MQFGTRRRWAAIVVAGTAALGACGEDASPEAVAADAVSTSAPATSAPATTPATVPASVPATVAATVAPGFPVTVTGANGEVTIAAAPERIVVLSATLTESVFAIGAGDQVVAVDSASSFPAEAPVTELSGFRPNVEAIAAYEPDLVLLARDRDDIVATLATAGITALVLPSAASLDDVYAQIDTLGAATGHAEAAADLSAGMRAAIDAQIDRVPDHEVAPTYFFELSGEFHTNTSDTFAGSILTTLGLANVADGVDPAAGAYPQLSAEYVLEADPDWVFVAHTDGSVPTDAELAGRAGWGNLRAIAGGHVVLLDPEVASRWGPRVVDLVTVVVDSLVGGASGVATSE